MTKKRIRIRNTFAKLFCRLMPTFHLRPSAKVLDLQSADEKDLNPTVSMPRSIFFVPKSFGIPKTEKCLESIGEAFCLLWGEQPIIK